MQKITRTTESRSLDEDLRRLYAELTSLRAAVTALQKLTAAPTNTSPIAPLPPVIPGSAGSTVEPVEASGVVGILSTFSASDHAHEGLHSIAANGQPQITGDGVLHGGTGITLAQVGNDITINGVFGTVTPTVVLPAASPYTVGGGDIVIFANTTTGPITIQLVGGAINTGRFVWINNRGVGANAVTVTTTSGSVLNVTSLAASAGALYVSDGTNWYSIENSTGN